MRINITKTVTMPAAVCQVDVREIVLDPATKKISGMVFVGPNRRRVEIDGMPVVSSIADDLSVARANLWWKTQKSIWKSLANAGLTAMGIADTIEDSDIEG